MININDFVRKKNCNLAKTLSSSTYYPLKSLNSLAWNSWAPKSKLGAAVKNARESGRKCKKCQTNKVTPVKLLEIVCVITSTFYNFSNFKTQLKQNNCISCLAQIWTEWLSKTFGPFETYVLNWKRGNSEKRTNSDRCQFAILSIYVQQLWEWVTTANNGFQALRFVKDNNPKLR